MFTLFFPKFFSSEALFHLCSRQPCIIGKCSGQERHHPQVGRRNKLLPCFFKNREEISFDTQKNLHGKNQRVFKKQRSKHEELTFTIRNNLVDQRYIKTEFLLKDFKNKALLWFWHIFLYQETDQSDFNVIKRAIHTINTYIHKL